MDTFMSALIKMSLRGIVIILVVLVVRFLLKKLRISHKYILGLWAMSFLFFIFPWKLSLSIGFWNNVNIPEEVREFTENLSGANEDQGMTGNTVGIINPSVVNNIPDSMSFSLPEDNMQTVTTKPIEQTGQSMAGVGEIKDGSSEKLDVESMIGLIWLVGLSSLFGHMLYSYFSLKRKLRLSVLFEDNIWWAEKIDIPMVFGLVRSQIYLPVSMEFDNLSYVVAHEKMHIKRKDGLIKMFVYVICLIHWFNPFIWIAYILFAGDMEKACDEEVIRGIGKEKRKEYAYALLHIASENETRKKRVFVVPICFDEGNVKSRIRNIMKYKYTLPGIGTVVVIVILALSAIFLTEAKNSDEIENEKTEGLGEDITGGSDEEYAGADTVNDEVTEALPMFFVADLDSLQIEDNFSLEDCCITSRYIASNHYYIDEDGVLWGTGKNEYGQLGTGTYGYDEMHEEPVRIAEHVVSVDASWNGYFCIYLTEGGELYGIGENYVGILHKQYSKNLK